MQTITDLLKNFFTHKDFLPPADQIAGTLFTPLHFGFAAGLLALLLLTGFLLAKKSEKTIRITLGVLWGIVTVMEIAKILWETYCGQTVNLDETGILPLYPCSIFMYEMPLALWGKGTVRYSGCGYVCTLGLLGASINFIYPASVLGTYSCLSFAGLQTFLFHGAMLFCALVMLKSGYHSYKTVTHPQQLLLPAVPALVVSVVANLVNFSPIDADYMFFKLESFFFAPIGAATPDWLSVILVYFVYLVIHALPYLPFYFINRKEQKKKETAAVI